MHSDIQLHYCLQKRKCFAFALARIRKRKVAKKNKSLLITLLLKRKIIKSLMMKYDLQIKAFRQTTVDQKLSTLQISYRDNRVKSKKKKALVLLHLLYLLSVRLKYPTNSWIERNHLWKPHISTLLKQAQA